MGVWKISKLRNIRFGCIIHGTEKPKVAMVTTSTEDKGSNPRLVSHKADRGQDEIHQFYMFEN